MSEIVLLHSVLGVRPGVPAAAGRLRAAGHRVHVPDLYGGRVFDDYQEAGDFVRDFGGYPELLRRTAAAVEDLPAGLVYAGFSNGGGGAGYLAAARPGARAALLMHAALPLGVINSIRPSEPPLAWPRSVPVQVHYGRDDPFRSEDGVRAFAEEVADSGARYQYFEYPSAGHLFADESRPAEYDPACAELLWERALAFLAQVED